MTIGLTTNYFSFGSGVPSTAPSVASGEYALYQNTANGDLYEWNLSGTPGWTKVFDHAGGTTSLTTAESIMGSNHTISGVGTFDTLVSLSLVAGVWDIEGHTMAGDSSAIGNLSARLFDGTTGYAGDEFTSGGANFRGGLNCRKILTLASTTTISFQGRSTVGATTTFYSSTPNGATAGATKIQAIKIG